jgi:hypothetical protein
MKLASALVLFIIYSWANAAHDFPTVQAYVEQAVGDRAAPHVLSQSGQFTFGIARTEALAIVFVLKVKPDGSVLEVARSKAFDFSDPKARIFISNVEAQSERRFSIQLNYQNACDTETTFDLYRFVQVGQAWYVAGLDSSRCLWPDDAESHGATRKVRSANFLTGTVVETLLRDTVRLSYTRKQVKFQQFPLTDFEAFDEKYGPR